MREILVFKNDDSVWVRTLARDEDIYNIFPQGDYTERPATMEDVKKHIKGFEKWV